MKILYAVRGLNQSSGTTHAIIPCAEEMARRGHDVELYAVRKPDGTKEMRPDEGLVKASVFDMSLPIDNPGFSLDFRKAIEENVKKCDVVHIQAVRNLVTLQTMRAAASAGVPYIVAPQGSYNQWVLEGRTALHRYYDRFAEIPLLKKAARIQCLSEAETKEVSAMGIGAPSVVIPNGITLSEQLSAPPRRNGKTLLYLGRLNEKKGLDILISAFTQIAEQVPGSRLVIAGSDGGSGYAGVVGRMAADAAAATGARIQFVGEVSGEAKEKLLRKSSIFVLTSYSEGLPLAILEALAYGLPVVITEQCNVPEVGKAGAGIVCETDAAQVRAAIMNMLSNAETLARMGSAARVLAEDRFSWRYVGDILEELYGNMCKGELS